MRSVHSPERLEVELRSRLGPSLSQKGYRLVGYGPAGVTWRRELTRAQIGSLVVLGILALGGLAAGGAGSILFGLLCAGAAALLVYLRGPASVSVDFTRMSGGTEISVTGGRDAARVYETARAVAGAAPELPSEPDPGALAESIAQLLQEARKREARIAQAIDRAELPYDEVAGEVERFVVAMERTARRAQLLHEALEDTPPAQAAARLAQVRDDPERAGLAEALQTQLRTLERMQRQLDRFYAELERLLVELDTVRSQLVSVSASTETAEQGRLAEEVRGLRERMGTVAEGMATAYEPPEG